MIHIPIASFANSVANTFVPEYVTWTYNEFLFTIDHFNKFLASKIRAQENGGEAALLPGAGHEGPRRCRMSRAVQIQSGGARPTICVRSWHLLHVLTICCSLFHTSSRVPTPVLFLYVRCRAWRWRARAGNALVEFSPLQHTGLWHGLVPYYAKRIAQECISPECVP